MENLMIRDDWQLRLLILGGSISQFITVVADLEIADYLKDKNQSVEVLSSKLNMPRNTVYRIMRIGTSLNLFQEEKQNEFSLTPMGELLQTDIEGSLREYAILKGQDWARASLTGLKNSFFTEEPAFNNVFGEGIFDYLEKNSLSEQYHKSLKNISSYHDPFIAKAYDFASVNSVTDVGGGMGSLLATILKSNEHLKGTHFDQASASISARNSVLFDKLINRCEFIEGDFFKKVPQGSDVYILKTILHDWDDEKAIKILKNIRRAIPYNGKLLIIEIVLPSIGKTHPRTVMDLEMLIFYGGRERTVNEYETLLEKSRFSVNRNLNTGTDVSIIEAIPM
jgi:ubiquinone/menaquinone biosynthesis C-methylase UbiE